MICVTRGKSRPTDEREAPARPDRTCTRHPAAAPAFIGMAALCLLTVVAGCAASAPLAHGPSDADANEQTRALFLNLKRLAPHYVLFGHHDDLAYGVNWRGEKGRSDVKEVTGSYPAVYGWDANRLFRRRQLDEKDSQGFDQLKDWMIEAYRRGGVSTLCWHLTNPVSGGHSWDTTRAVHAILPGGSRHETYKAALDIIADFLKGLKSGPFAWLGLGSHVPVIFRPFHEHTGSWFWWGRRHSTTEEFVALWRFTVEYLRNEKDVHNVLYAYSTDVFDSEADYLERYPGDEYIDLLGFDDYHSIKSGETRDVFVHRLRTIARLADARGKLAALTETGVEAIPDSTWWTRVLLPGLKADSLGRSMSFVLVWRNANRETDRPDHFYAPYPGHPSAADLVRFYQDDFVLFENELPGLYRLP